MSVSVKTYNALSDTMYLDRASRIIPIVPFVVVLTMTLYS